MKKLLFIALAAVLALSVGLVGCTGEPPTEYTLTITTAGDGSGSVTDPGEGAFTYSPGEVVDLVATPDADNYFVNWTGDVGTVADVINNVTTITMNGNYDIVANFEGPWDDVITLSFHCTANSKASVYTAVQLPWMQAIEAASGSHGGTFDFDPVTFGESPYSPEDSLTAIGAGVVDVGQLQGDVFHLGQIAYIPGLFDMETQAYALATVFATDEVSDWDALGELDDVKVLLATPLWPNQWFGSYNLTELADLAGTDIRAEGGEVPTIEAWSAVPVEIGTGDIANALTLGLIDGCFFTWSAWSFGGIADAADYCTEVNLYPRAYFVAMDRDVYEGLHPEARALLDSFCEPADSVAWATAHAAGQGFSRTQCNNIVTNGIYVMPEEEREELLQATAGVGPDWVTYMTGLGFDGQGFWDRVQELIAATP